MLSCKELAQQFASDYIDENVSASQKRQIRFHLLICGHCRRFIKKMKISKQVLGHAGRSAITMKNLDETTVQALANDLRDAYISQIPSEDSSENKSQ